MKKSAIRGNRETRRGRAETQHNSTAGSSPQEHPVKSVRATSVVVAGVTLSG